MKLYSVDSRHKCERNIKQSHGIIPFSPTCLLLHCALLIEDKSIILSNLLLILNVIDATFHYNLTKQSYLNTP